MDIVPVLDLRRGLVVRAHMGQRDQYRPIETPLSRTSDPVDVARGLFSVIPFKTLYVADLDAIEGTGDNHEVLLRLKAEFPDVALWVDNAIADLHKAERWLEARLGRLVLGSESQKDMALVRHLCRNDRIILSLDFRDQVFQGPAGLLGEVGSWPRKIIVMTLARVGSGAGPAFDQLAAIREIAAGRDIYAAGGVRDGADLAALKRAGVAGALVATSLHNGRVTAKDVEAI